MIVNTVGVYGTLRKECMRGNVMEAPGINDLGKARITHAVLLNLGSFPTILFTAVRLDNMKENGELPEELSDTVVVEKYDITEVQGYNGSFRERVLDGIEGYPTLYNIAYVPEQGSAGTATLPVYALNMQRHNDWLLDSEIILSGDWFDREETIPMTEMILSMLGRRPAVSRVVPYEEEELAAVLEEEKAGTPPPEWGTPPPEWGTATDTANEMDNTFRRVALSRPRVRREEPVAPNPETSELFELDLEREVEANA
jgi:gamma-glutamylcyclotransferase (GGCT)/AIG2-like uncharacterized protein YtfP